MGPCLVLEEIHHPDFTHHSIADDLVEEEKNKVRIALDLERSS
jgi:hypothetical protein